MIALENPVYDLSPKDLPQRVRPPKLRCRFRGHDWSASGYANAHKYKWEEWQVGDFLQCKHCLARKFVHLKNREQLEEVLRIERERWATYYAKKDNGV